MSNGSETKERLTAMYAEGAVPWDDVLPPPEIQAVAATMPPGRALDLGCGYGRSAIYLAQRGWHVDGVDFVAIALEEAARRAEAAGVSVSFHEASVTDLGFLHPAYELAVDVGCVHALGEHGLLAYRNELRRLLAPDAIFVCFARLSAGSADSEDEGPRGLEEGVLEQVFSQGFELTDYRPGVTHMADGNSWNSAWFWFKRR